MTAPFMRAYTELLVATCHRRGAFAMGGMAAFIPSRRDPEVNEAALAKVRADKEREAGDGYDGSWVAHPDLVPICREVFDARARRPARTSSTGSATTSASTRRRAARRRVRPRATSPRRACAATSSVALRYLVSWLRGNGAAAIDNLMEDAATAEISRSQLWQWITTGSTTGRRDERSPPSSSAAARRGGLRRAAIAWADEPATIEPLDAGPRPVRAGGARRRLRRLPDPAGLRRVRRRDAMLARSGGPADLGSTRRPRRARRDRGTRPTRGWPGATPATPRGRQPVHTVYVPADRSTPRPRAELGRAARGGARRARADAGRARAALVRGRPDALARRSGRGCSPSSTREPIEDLRIDLEDGYGVRADDEEDARRALGRAGAGRRRAAGVRTAVLAASGSSRSRRRPGAAGCGRSTCSSATLLDAAALPGRVRS